MGKLPVLFAAVLSSSVGAFEFGALGDEASLHKQTTGRRCYCDCESTLKRSPFSIWATIICCDNDRNIVLDLMALFDNKWWLLSHIRHSFLLSDETGNAGEAFETGLEIRNRGLGTWERYFENVSRIQILILEGLNLLYLYLLQIQISLIKMAENCLYLLCLLPPLPWSNRWNTKCKFL